MGSSLCRLLVHVIFSTKGRAALISDDIAPRLYAYIGGVVSHRHGNLIAAGGVEDHVHLLIDLHQNIAVAELVRDIKANSSRWLREEDLIPDFAWQTGYAAFSVSRSNSAAVVAYISNQRLHHARRPFADELIDFLHRHEIEYDPQYVLD